MVALCERLADSYADWRNDLPVERIGADGQAIPGWRTFFAECPPLDFAPVQDDPEIADDAPVWPGRRANRPDGAPELSHVCRPFDDIQPARVRVVVLGEDPYPSISAATGRAFEDGTPDAAREALKLALRVLGQSALDIEGAAYPAGFCHGRAGRAAAIRGCFNRLVQQDVLCLNVAWTYSEEGHKERHRRLWSPITRYMLQRLAERPQGPPVVLLLGAGVGTSFDAFHLQNVPEDVIVRSDHPSERNNRYFARPNPLQKVNAVLQARGQNSVTWWSMPDGMA